VDTIGLGVNPVSPLEMASAYATLAAGGVLHQPYAVVSVVFGDGHTDRSWRASRGRRVLPAAVAYELTRVLEEVIAHGTGTAANPGRPAAGKTGTTNALADAWFDGYTPDLATAVWVGYPNARIPMKHVHGIEVFGGTFPAQIWRSFVTGALKGERAAEFESPGTAIRWKRWCGRFQYARSYADARPTAHCTKKVDRHRKTNRRTSTKKTTTTSPTTTPRFSETTVTVAPRTVRQPTTTELAPPTTTSTPETTVATTAAETTTPATTSVTTTTTTTGG
jgi:penicillin-binding protein 1A